jgi:hypothetical protein
VSVADEEDLLAAQEALGADLGRGDVERPAGVQGDVFVRAAGVDENGARLAGEVRGIVGGEIALRLPSNSR